MDSQRGDDYNRNAGGARRIAAHLQPAKARSEHAKQFGRMSILFDTADRRLEALLSAGRYADARDLIRDLGREALLENGDWVLLHRERPLEVPHAA